MKATLKNTSAARQGVWADGKLEWIDQGAQRTLTFSDDEFAGLRARHFTVTEKDDATVAPATGPEPIIEAEAPAEEALDTKTVVELRALAAAEEIDLQGATLKADIIAAIELAHEDRG